MTPGRFVLRVDQGESNSGHFRWKVPAVEQDQSDAQFNTITARLLRREALRRAAEELNTTSGPGLEGVLGRISAEVTADALGTRTKTEAEINSEPAAR